MEMIINIFWSIQILLSVLVLGSLVYSKIKKKRVLSDFAFDMLIGAILSVYCIRGFLESLLTTFYIVPITMLLVVLFAVIFKKHKKI